MADEYHLVEATRRTAGKPFPAYRLRSEALASMSRSVTYRRRTIDETDQKIIEHGAVCVPGESVLQVRLPHALRSSGKRRDRRDLRAASQALARERRNRLLRVREFQIQLSDASVALREESVACG